MVNLEFSFLMAFLLLNSSWAAEGGVDCSQGPLKNSRQIVLSVSPHWNATQVRIQRFIRAGNSEPWKAKDEVSFSGVVGKSGMGWGLGEHPAQTGPYQKREGDGRAPAGIFALFDGFGYHRAEAAGISSGGLKYTQVDENSKCIDDVKSSHYNQMVYHAPQVKADWAPGVEDLRRSDALYEYAMGVDHNGMAQSGVSPVAGAGSCIFVHVWSAPGQGTQGCTAMASHEMRALLSWVSAQENPKLVQLPLEEYQAHKKDWCLPQINEQQILKDVVGSTSMNLPQHEKSRKPAVSERDFK